MNLSSLHRNATVDSRATLLTALAERDQRGGAEFWLAPASGRFPSLAIRFSGELADVHYFPHSAHPGFRLLSELDLPGGGTTLFVYEGCDPASGESVPNEFVTTARRAISIAGEFFQTQQLLETDSWFEL